MLQSLVHLLTQSSNQFLSGGLVLMTLGSLLVYAKQLPYKLWKHFINLFTVVVDVQSTDKAYDWLLLWLHRHEYTTKARRLSVKHVRSNQGVSQFLLVPAKGQHWFFHGWKLVWLSRNKEDQPTISGSGGDISELLAPKETLSIRTIGRSKEVLLSILDQARTHFENIDKDVTIIHRYKWSSWRYTRKQKRPLESIMLPPDAESLVEDIERFVKAKDWYKQMGIPYRRGYLFHGPPGTGKTSTVEAIAGHLDLPLYLLNLASCSDSNLEEAFAELNSEGPCILLIEDIDTAVPKRTAEGEKQKVSLGTLLNVIDGVQAVDNVILIMTSNKPDTLDTALTRHGRVDKWLEFGMATEDQIKRAVNRFIQNPTFEQCQAIAQWPRPISMAEVQERLKQLVLEQ